MPRITTTILIGSNARRSTQYEVEVVVFYEIGAGYTDTYGQPGEQPEVEITNVTVLMDGHHHLAEWLADVLEGDDEIIALCLADAFESRMSAEEARAEARAEALWER